MSASRDAGSVMNFVEQAETNLRRAATRADLHEVKQLIEVALQDLRHAGNYGRSLEREIDQLERQAR